MILDRLNSKPKKPAYLEPLRRFNRAVVAKELGITGPWLSNIMNGNGDPGPELKQKILDLMAEIEAAELENA